MNISNLRMDARFGGVTVHWTVGDGYGYVAPLELTGRGGAPVRPFRVKETRPIGHKVAKRYLFRRRPGEEPGSRIDSEAKAHASMVAEALHRAEDEGLYEAALANIEEQERQRLAEERKVELAAIHETLDELIKSEDQAVSQRSLMLKHAGDEALLVIVRKLRIG